MAVQKEIQELKEQSLAMELIKDYKRQSKRQFIVILVILTMWFATIGYLIYILNDISVEKTTETYEVEQNADDNGNNNFVHGNNNEVK